MNSISVNSEVIKNYLEALAIIIGGLWTIWRFVLQGEAHAKIEFNVDLKIIGIHKNQYLIEVIAVVENKGSVRQYLSDFEFDLLSIDNDKELDDCGQINKQVVFVKKRQGCWIPSKWRKSFIDSGIKQYYTYVSSLPIETKYVLLYAKFLYPGVFKDFHTSQKVFNIDVMLRQL